jgi:hypothetical protein
MRVDAYVKGMHRIAQTFRNGIQSRIPAWNPANAKYVGYFTVEDPEVDPMEVEAIFKNPDYPIPSGASRKKRQLLEALKRFSKLHKQFVSTGVNDSSRVTPKGIQIQFDLGANSEAFKSAVQKMSNMKQATNVEDEDLEALTPEEMAQGVVEGRIDFRKLSDKRKQAVLQTFPQINKSAPIEDQVKALGLAIAVQNGSPASEIANILMQQGVINGVDLNTLETAMLKGIAQAMKLNVAKLRKTGIIKVIQAALTQGDIQNVSDLGKMSRNQIAALLERGRVAANQMAEDQIDNMLDFYKMPPNQDKSKRPEQLQFVVAMKASLNKVNPAEFVNAMQRGVFSADDLAQAGIPNSLIQKMLISAKQQVKKADRGSLINQLKSLEPKTVFTKNWKDAKIRNQSSSAEVIQAIAENKLAFSDLTREEIKKIFDPGDKTAADAIDQLSLEKLAEIMPEIIDEGNLRINDASAKKLQAYLKGKGFQQRLSGSLDGLRKQAKSVQGKARAEQISKSTVAMATDLLSDGLNDEGEEFKTMHVRSAINKALKNIQGDDDAYQKLMELDEDDQATELAKIGRTIFFQRKKGVPSATGESKPKTDVGSDTDVGKPEPEDLGADEEEKTGSESTLDADVNRTINGIIQQLKKWGKDQGPVKQRLSDLARELIAQGMKSNSTEFAQKLFNKYHQKYGK